MSDEQDKIIPVEENPIMMADDQTGTSGNSQIITDLNQFSTEISDKRKSLTPEFINSTDREALETKRLEIKTIQDLYLSRYLELHRPAIDATRLTSIDNQKAVVDNINAQIKQMFEKSKFGIADATKQTLDGIYSHLKKEKEEITSEFLQKASTEELETKKSLHTERYDNFQFEYSLLILSNLKKKDQDDIAEKKVWVDTISQNIDSYIQGEINTREQRANKAKEDEQLLLAQKELTIAQIKTKYHLVSEEEVIRLKEQLSTEQEKVGSLENKLENEQKWNNQYENGFPGEIYEGYDEMVGDNKGLLEDEKEQGITSLKIDSIQLPFFNGNLEDWESFRELFEYLVDKSKKLSKAVKFHQLRTHLRGPALDTIRGYQLTGANYESAWKDLKNRYDRTNELVDEYIRKFFEVRAIEYKTTFANVRAIIDVTNQMMRALPGLGVPVDQWDPVVRLIICSKLNDELRNEWKHVVGRDTKTVKDLLEHLETKAIDLQPSQGERLSHMLRGDNKRSNNRKVFQVTEKKECLICKQNHNIWDCHMFKNECAKAKKNIVRTLGLCFKCLLKHRADMCEEEDCEYCGQSHNILLCFRKEYEDKMKSSGRPDQQLKSNWKSKPTQNNWQPKPSTSHQHIEDWGKKDWNSEDHPNKQSVKKNFKK